jgi:predicted dehydrogenase
MSKHSILVIGVGSIGERHVRCFQTTGRVDVVACDTNSELLQRVGDTYEVQTVRDWKAALTANAPTAVVVCTPAPDHVPLASAALLAGCHVLIEKPLSHSLEGTTELIATRHRRGRQVAVAYVYRVFPMLLRAQAHLRDVTTDPIQQVVVHSGQPFHRLRKGYATTYYRDHRTGGGAIQDALTHSANWVESVIGPTDSVLCDSAHLVLPDVEVEDTVHLSARHGRVLVSYMLNQFQAPDETTIQLNTARESVRIELHRQRWGFFCEGDTDWTWEDMPATNRDAHFITQANAFLDQIEGQPPRLCSLEEAVQTLKFNLAALAAARTGTRVSCHDLHY